MTEIERDLLVALNIAIDWYTPPNDSNPFPLKQLTEAKAKACGLSSQQESLGTQEGAAPHFWPVGHINTIGQVIAELRIAGQRMEIQAGVMKQWSERFFALAESLKASGPKAANGDMTNPAL